MSEQSRDYVGEFLAKRNAIAAAAPNPFSPVRDPNDQPPAPTGDPVQDFVNRLNYENARRPNPLAPRPA